MYRVNGTSLRVARSSLIEVPQPALVLIVLLPAKLVQVSPRPIRSNTLNC